LIWRAKGWVASTIRVTRSARMKLARPSTPPKPPLRTSPASGAGSRVRPASEVITRASGWRATRSRASSAASLVPPRIRMVWGAFGSDGMGQKRPGAVGDHHIDTDRGAAEHVKHGVTRGFADYFG